MAAWLASGMKLAFPSLTLFNTGTMPMRREKPGKTRRRLSAAALIATGLVAFALTQWSQGAMEMAAWFVVAFCSGGLLSLFQRPRPS